MSEQKLLDNRYAAYGNTVATTQSGASQIILLYEGVVRLLLQAKEAMIHQDVQQHYSALHKASTVVMGMQQALDMAQGGQTAKALYDFYEVIHRRIMRLHTDPVVEECDKTLNCVVQMLNTWREVGENTNE